MTVLYIARFNRILAILHASSLNWADVESGLNRTRRSTPVGAGSGWASRDKSSRNTASSKRTRSSGVPLALNVFHPCLTSPVYIPYTPSPYPPSPLFPPSCAESLAQQLRTSRNSGSFLGCEQRIMIQQGLLPTQTSCDPTFFEVAFSFSTFLFTLLFIRQAVFSPGD